MFFGDGKSNIYISDEQMTNQQQQQQKKNGNRNKKNKFMTVTQHVQCECNIILSTIHRHNERVKVDDMNLCCSSSRSIAHIVLISRILAICMLKLLQRIWYHLFQTWKSIRNYKEIKKIKKQKVRNQKVKI